MFVNTVDVVGDEALTSAIIDGSLEELNDSELSEIPESTIRGFDNLKTARFLNVKTIGGSGFAYLNQLEKVDFYESIEIIRFSFFSCSKLKAIILRNSVMSTLGNAEGFKNTPINSGAGYIYVPAALVDSYKAASFWSTYANQIRALESYTVDGTITGELDETKI